MPLGATSPAAVWKGAVMQTSPDGTLKDLQCRRSSLANIGVAYLRICVNQHYICSAPLSHLLCFCCTKKRTTLGHELLPYSHNVWDQTPPGILRGKFKKRAVVTLLAKCCEKITGIHCYFHTAVTGETNSRHFENVADVL